MRNTTIFLCRNNLLVNMSASTIVYGILFFVGSTLAAQLAENYDVTTMLKLVESAPGVFEPYGPLTVVARGNARGLPLRRGQTLINATFAGQPCCTSWTHEAWTKLDSATAEAAKPPLDPQETATDGEIAPNSQQDNSDKLAIISERSQEDYTIASEIWQGKLPLDGRIRMAMRLPTSGNATLALYLCDDVKEEAEKECVAFLLTGYDSQHHFLRYEALHLSKNGTGSEVETPIGKLRGTVLHQNNTAPETWGTGFTYNFVVERSSTGRFEVRLDGADIQQKRLMGINGTNTMKNFAARVLNNDNGFLDVKSDPTWYGYIRPGGEIRIRYTPPNSGSAHLGIFICKDRFQEECVGEVLSGHSEGALRFITGKYGPNERSTSLFWVAGTEERLYRITELGRSEYVRARWEPVRPYAFSVSRSLDGTVRVRLDGGDEEKDQRWPVPKEYKHIFVASYHHEGSTYVQGALGRCGGSTACTAPAPVWVLQGETGELRSPSMPASASGRRICVTIVARISPKSTVSVAVQRTGGTEKLQLDTLRVGPNDFTQWITKRIVKTTSRAVREQPLDIVVTATQPAGNPNPVMVQWVTACNPEGEEDVYTVSESTSMKLVASSSGFDVMARIDTVFGATAALPNPVCLNNGLLDLVTNKCRCVPGFSGDVCDTGCGPNAFGLDCQGRCTKTSAGRQCRGMLLCGPGGTCDCAPGLGGPRCEDECEPGRFGTGCRRACGQCTEGATCDPFTGRCEDGCSGALQPPFCLEECGRDPPVVSLISNGADAKPEDFPWHAGVYDTEFRNKSNVLGTATIEQICGATLVKPKILISAAHCFFSEEDKTLQTPTRFKIAVGKKFRGWDDKEKPADRVQRRDVLWIHIPVAYRGNLRTYSDDIALIEIAIPIVTTIYVAPICVDWSGSYASILEEGARGSVVGWGRTEHHEPSTQLRVATLPYVGTEECFEKVSQSFWPYLNKDKFCAGDNKGAAVGNGDSGGGMVFKNSDHGAWYLRGVVSVGPPADLSYTAYTNVSSYQKWLSDLKNQADIRAAFLTAILTV